MDVPDKIKTWQMVAPWKKDKESGTVTEGQLELTQIPVPELKEGEALVEVAGCGVCHTDLGYYYHGVPTVTEPPLTLGHEVAGVVVAGDPAYVGKEVIVPAVMPCNSCPICESGRGNRCLGQKMPAEEIKTAIADNPDMTDSFNRILEHLAANEVDLEKEPLTLGPMLTMDPEKEQFVGEHSDMANMLVKRNYREPFVVPDKV